MLEHPLPAKPSQILPWILLAWAMVPAVQAQVPAGVRDAFNPAAARGAASTLSTAPSTEKPVTPVVREGSPILPPVPVEPSDEAAPADASSSAGMIDPYNYARWSSEEINRMSELRSFKIKWSVTSGYWYDDNLYLTSGQNGQPKTADSYANLRGQVNMTYRSSASPFSITLDYTPDYEWYLGHKAKDAFNQTFNLSSRLSGAKTNIFGNLVLSDTTGGQPELTGRVRQRALMGSAGISYSFTDKITGSISYSATLKRYETDGAIPSDQQSVGASLDYRVTPKTSLGLGANSGLTHAEGGSDYRTYDLNLRANWAATQKLVLKGSAGYQLLQGKDSDFSSNEPIMDLGVDYDLLGDGKTSASLNTYRRIQPSASLVNQSYWSNGIVLGLGNQVTERIRLDLALGYELASYQATAANVETDRQDKLLYLRPRLAYAIARSLSASLFYQYSSNTSTGTGAHSFNRNAVGLSLTYGY